MSDQKHTQQFSQNSESTNTPNPLHQLRKADSVLSIVQADIPQPCIIVPSILTAGEATLLAAGAGSGQTYISQYIAACVAAGTTSFGNEPCEAKKVLYIDAELGLHQIQTRFANIFNAIGAEPGDPFFRVIHRKSIPGGMPDLATPDGFDALASDIEWADVVIFDNLSALYTSAEELNQNDWNYYNKCIDALRNEEKAILILHHTDKTGKNYRGHTEIARAVDNVLIAAKDLKLSTNAVTVVDIAQSKSRNGASSEKLMSIAFGDIYNEGRFLMIRAK